MQQNSIMRPRPSRPAFLMLLMAALLLSACSMLNLAYRNGETLSYWWINGYIDVESSQRPWLKERIGRLFDWHRKTQLGDYIDLLVLAQKQLQHPVDRQLLQNDLAEVKKRIAVIVEHALPDMADLALDLRPQQIEEIAGKFASANSDYRKNYLRGDTAQRQRYRFKNFMGQAEYWFGDFSREQESQIRKALDAVPIDNDRYFAARLQRQRELLDVLRKIHAERPSREATMQLLRGQAMALFEPPGGAEHAAFFAARQEGMLNAAVMVINSATPAQRKRAVAKLQDFIDDFRRLTH